MHHIRTTDAAHGKWRGILLELGMPSSFLINKHGPCPMCGGKDRFRWDNKEGMGTFICSNCGAGDGMQLAKLFTGYEFKELANKIDAIVNNIKYDPKSAQSNEINDEKKRAMLRQVYAASVPVQKGDLVDKYLTSRGIHEMVYPSSLRFASSISDGEGGMRPCMVAMVVDVSGKPISLHRTFLEQNGRKALMQSPRKMMPGNLPDGACIRLTEEPSPHIGVAEGIETAMSACNLFGFPVWPVVNAVMMEKWIAPEGVESVTVFGDMDANYRGHKAAYTLANKLSMKGLEVDVQFPDKVGIDWNDVLKEMQK